MSRFTSKQEFINEITKERTKLEELLDEIPTKMKTVVITDNMSVKDFLAHRTEWGRMMLSWYKTAKKGDKPAVPSEKYKWNQLKELNADIYKKFKKTSLKKIEADFKTVHDELYKTIKSLSEKELFEKDQYNFTGSSNLSAYLNSATAAHYRSARRHIQKWWKSQN